MGVDVQVRTERNDVLEEITDPKSVIARLLDKAYAARFPHLRFVDRYGNTYFNTLQLKEVIPELRQLHRLAESDDERAAVTEVERLAQVASSQVHTYLVFVGD